MIPFPLSDAQIQTITEIAERRNAKAYGVQEKGVALDKMSALEINRIGVAGEMIAAAVLGYPFNGEIYPLGGDGHRPDGVMPDGTTVEVKSRPYGGDFALYPEEGEHLRADIGVLIYRSEDDWHDWAFYGTITREKFEERKTQIAFGRRGLRWGVRPYEMRQHYPESDT